mmetsp:Transcript_33540/g.79588  ORF Transcript_33540/g.79588 Transcript_33540/m.79588 type:complete len:131 (-) Transcript_33540:22-414(-)
MSEDQRKSLQDAANAALAAEQERERLLAEGRADRDGDGAPDQRRKSFAERQAEGGDFAKKRLSKAAQRTLEAVWQQTHWPSDEVVRSVYRLHRVPRQRVLQWFSERRASEGGDGRERRRGRRERGGEGRP